MSMWIQQTQSGCLRASRRFQEIKGWCNYCFTPLINMTRTTPRLPISLTNINSLIIAACWKTLIFHRTCLCRPPVPRPTTQIISTSLLCLFLTLVTSQKQKHWLIAVLVITVKQPPFLGVLNLSRCLLNESLNIFDAWFFTIWSASLIHHISLSKRTTWVIRLPSSLTEVFPSKY